MAELKVNSLRLRFERGSAEPSEEDIFAFMRDKMKLRSDELLAMYKDKSSMSVIIKFKAEEDMLKALERLPGVMDFVIDKYRSCKVTLSAANSVVRYVRLFNLSPEIEDKEIWAVMSKYGNIQRMVRESYGTETGFPIWTSVRGLYIELKEGEEIPATVNVRNTRARVFYAGLVNKCYQCGSTEHLKADCPARRSVNDRLKTDQASSYSGALKGVWSKPKSVADRNQQQKENGGTMTNLNTMLAAGPSSRASKNLVADERKTKGDEPLERINEQDQQTKPKVLTHTSTDNVGHTPAIETDEVQLQQTMEVRGGAHATIEDDNGAALTPGACSEAAQQMETEGSSLKRVRDGIHFNESDDSSQSDTLTAEKADGGEQSTISGWLKVMTRNRNKQMKISESQNAKGKKQIGGKPSVDKSVH